MLAVAAAERAILTALAEAVAFATRKEIVDSSEACEEHLHRIAERILFVAGTLLHAAASPTSAPTSKAAACDLAAALLKCQTLHAAARQSAAALSQLASQSGPEALSASGVRLRQRAAELLTVNLQLVFIMSTLALERADKARVAAILSDLQESALLSHVGRLVITLLPAPGPAAARGPPGPPAPPAQLLLAHARAAWAFCTALFIMDGLYDALDKAARPSIRRALGPCVLHAAAVLGTAALSAADLQPCGLPHSPLPQPQFLRGAAEYPCMDHTPLVLLVQELWRDPVPYSRTALWPPVPPRTALRLVRRVLVLASASMRAAAGEYALTPSGMITVDLGWGGRRGASSGTFRFLIQPSEMGALAMQAAYAVVDIAVREPGAWDAEAPNVWGPLFSVAVHASDVLSLGQLDDMASYLGTLVGSAAGPLVGPPGAAPLLVARPAPLPRSAEAALQGGVVPLLESLLRATAELPSGPEARLVGRHVKGLGLEELVLHSPPCQAAAYVATLAKALRRTPAAVLLGGLRSVSAAAAAAPLLALVSAACRLIDCRTLALAYGAVTELAGPVDASAPGSPVFVLALAALQLLPELSRLVIEAAAVHLLEPPSVSSAGEGPRFVDARALIATVVLALLRALWWALNLRRLREAGTDRSHRLASALCLPFLVEEAGAVPLTGALLALLEACGHVPGMDASGMETLAEACLVLEQRYRPRVMLGKHLPQCLPLEEAPAAIARARAAPAAWRPQALRVLAAMLRQSRPGLSDKVSASADIVDGAWFGDGSESEGPLAALEKERLAALRAEACTVLLPACSNPACINLAGDSEAGLKLQHCARCRRASYCCRECQTAHWRSGHKKACGGGGSGSGRAG
ncbi:hypothetical protein HYH03_011382 [Edaphochlamys debaryana]|uniref:phytol kinase n=1 Tax=Edaphochlamys debaryana TaxID=47281 RepID=A0A836BWL1_9CHLO|nr:hypothetical protein HYH03_011382 [Edaphochlamys debaryana]|eukprot:KAG2490258.1 hypothetical protein HYH03_011382 [Edaphochlamys debaryana]